MNSDAKIFDSVLDTFENEDIKKFAKNCIDTIPSYFIKLVHLVQESGILHTRLDILDLRVTHVHW